MNGFAIGLPSNVAILTAYLEVFCCLHYNVISRRAVEPQRKYIGGAEAAHPLAVGLPLSQRYLDQNDLALKRLNGCAWCQSGLIPISQHGSRVGRNGWQARRLQHAADKDARRTAQHAAECPGQLLRLDLATKLAETAIYQTWQGVTLRRYIEAPGRRGAAPRGLAWSPDSPEKKTLPHAFSTRACFPSPPHSPTSARDPHTVAVTRRRFIPYQTLRHARTLMGSFDSNSSHSYACFRAASSLPALTADSLVKCEASFAAVIWLSVRDGTVTMPATVPIPGAVAPQNTQAPARRRKKKRGMKPADPAAKVIKGFDTPVTSGGEESDYSAISTPRIDAIVRTPVTAAQSPIARPASALTRAISCLKLGDPALHGQAQDQRRGSLLSESRSSSRRSDASSSASKSDASDLDAQHFDTYDVPITRDFASADTRGEKPIYAGAATEGGLRQDSPHRKMAAADFEPLKCLGKGAYGTVLLVKQHSTGRLFAQKQLKKATVTVHKHLVEMTKSERAILESVNRHPFVVKLFYAFQDHAKLYLILEYAQGGELFHHLAQERMFSEEVSAFYMAEMVLALDYLHRNLGVVYRDLKPENCLLDAEGHLLITDFGLSKVTVTDDADGQKKCDSMGIGTIDYMAPEIIQGKPYDAAVDWWSLGALGYDLLTGAPPFASQNHAKTQQKIVHGKVSMPYFLGPDSKDLLTRLLRKEPRKRLGGNMPKDLAIIKSHRFFRRIDWQKLERRECEAPITPIITDPAEAENFSKDFTDLAMSPVELKGGFLAGRSVGDGDAMEGVEVDPFGGFSYVASNSLLECSLLDNTVF
ncbi:hypothetical protein FH972_022251 [Carpinus fangiana]|uniref:Protein kinase domain-containing protein n=1 Tax=Carpinus fangiana TaxID=176857 RepID=A0A5N6KS26_9ROSI|nr:hypothetical protein FH972_022251 [Carpinus fangiana]